MTDGRVLIADAGPARRVAAALRNRQILNQRDPEARRAHCRDLHATAAARRRIAPSCCGPR